MPDTLIIVSRSILHNTTASSDNFQFLANHMNVKQTTQLYGPVKKSEATQKTCNLQSTSVSLGQRINVLVIRQSIIDYFNFQYQIQYFGNLAIKINIKDLSIALYFENFGLRTSSLIFLALTLVRSIQECMHPYSYNTVCIQVEWRD